MTNRNRSHRAKLIVLASCAILFLVQNVASAQSILNGGFENPNVGPGNYLYQPASASWTFLSGAGISNTNSAFTSSAPEVPEGQQVAYIQNQGQIRQDIFVSKNTILSFHATQRVNFGSAQSLKVLVGGTLQTFTLGAPTGSVATTSITPPLDYYQTYAVNITLPAAKYDLNQPLVISGLNTVGDATAFIDAVSISTPTSHAFGLWDSALTSATWRSDYASPTTTIATGPCLYTAQGSGADPIDGAGATPYGSGYGGSNTPCFGAPGSGYSYPAFNATNWYSSAQYQAGYPHWLFAVNHEYDALESPSCANRGPPNESRPLVSPGAPGSSLAISALTAQSDPAIGNYNVVSLWYSQAFPPASNAETCQGDPYLAFGVNATHGNVQPIALLDSAGLYRSHLKFKSSIFSIDPSTLGNTWLVIGVNGWNDNIQRLIFIDTMDQLNSNWVPGTQPLLKTWWNWNVKNSYFYPGAISTVWTPALLNSTCGMSIPTLSAQNTYVGSNQSPSSISSYDIDLYQLVHCVAANGAWGGNSAQQPNPIIISHVEWAVELSEVTGTTPSAWLAFWDPTVN